MNYNTSTITEERSSQMQNEDLSSSSVLLTGAEYDRYHHYKESGNTRRNINDTSISNNKKSSSWKYKRYASLSSQREQQELDYSKVDNNRVSTR